MRIDVRGNPDQFYPLHCESCGIQNHSLVFHIVEKADVLAPWNGIDSLCIQCCKCHTEKNFIRFLDIGEIAGAFY
jgi:hypothetical protein